MMIYDYILSTDSNSLNVYGGSVLGKTCRARSVDEAVFIQTQQRKILLFIHKRNCQLLSLNSLTSPLRFAAMGSVNEER